jgi:uncharacterized protein YbbK (DUF523 family)
LQPKSNSLNNNILISACLLGEKVRYDGTDSLLDHALIKKWQTEGRLIPICPEVAGGLPVPRAPSEIVSHGATVQIINTENKDVTEQFIQGAQAALQQAQKHHCIAAILTENSPSCGSQSIYDGRFSGTKKQGVGITTALLRKNGVAVFNQYQLAALKRFLEHQ